MPEQQLLNAMNSPTVLEEKTEEERRAGMDESRSDVFWDFWKVHGNVTVINLFMKTFKAKKHSRSKKSPQKFTNRREIVQEKFQPEFGFSPAMPALCSDVAGGPPWDNLDERNGTLRGPNGYQRQRGY